MLAHTRTVTLDTLAPSPTHRRRGLVRVCNTKTRRHEDTKAEKLIHLKDAKQK